MAIKILDTGGDLMLSGDDEAEVRRALEDHVSRGSRVITVPSRVGQRWVAACSIPVKAFDADKTSTLNLAAIQAAQQAKQAPPAAVPPSAWPAFEGCTIEAFGLKRIITAPSREHLSACLAALRELGADLESDMEEQDGVWIAVVDTARAQRAS